MEFGKIDSDMWGFPDWVDHDEAAESIAKQGDAAIMYGGMASYHHMCRFYSGYRTSFLLVLCICKNIFANRSDATRFFYKHELLAKYEWYWRLEPEIKYFCDIT